MLTVAGESLVRYRDIVTLKSRSAAHRSAQLSWAKESGKVKLLLEV